LEVSDSDIANLQVAIAADRDDAGGVVPAEPGSRVRAWLAEASTQFGTGAAANLIAAAVQAFFGG
jgi:hypothetical protein